LSEIRDPIYGFIEPSEKELKLINSRPFQRLRRVKQLAMEYLVYPSANHTRFEHSLGVYHIAGRIAEKLLPGDAERENREIIRLTALLHDIGHGPFSHTSEEVLEKFSEIPVGSSTNKIHELITADIIKSNEELVTLLSDYEREKIVGLLNNHKVDITLKRNIVSGPMDADKIDYFLRDSYCCGVKYGIFDLDRLLNVLTIIRDINGHDAYLGITNDGIHTLEQYFLAKYYLTTQVYFHKIRRVTDAMIVRGIELGIEQYGIKKLKQIYTYKPTSIFLNYYLAANDEEVFKIILGSNKKNHSTDIFERLLNRRLFKLAFNANINDIPFKKEINKFNIQNINKSQNKKLKSKLEERLAGVLQCPKELVVLQSSQIRSVKEMARDSEGEILVQRDSPAAPGKFHEESTIFRAINDKLNDVVVDVCAPIDYDNESEKYRKLSELKQPIMEILANEEVGD
jgi:HD superfamily phosphohydrolase